MSVWWPCALPKNKRLVFQYLWVVNRIKIKNKQELNNLAPNKCAGRHPVDYGRHSCKTTEYKSTDSPLPPLLNVMYCVRVSLVDSQIIPSATLKRRVSRVMSVYLWSWQYATSDLILLAGVRRPDSLLLGLRRVLSRLDLTAVGWPKVSEKPMLTTVLLCTCFLYGTGHNDFDAANIHYESQGQWKGWALTFCALKWQRAKHW